MRSRSVAAFQATFTDTGDILPLVSPSKSKEWGEIKRHRERERKADRQRKKLTLLRLESHHCPASSHGANPSIPMPYRG